MQEVVICHDGMLRYFAKIGQLHRYMVVGVVIIGSLLEREEQQLTVCLVI
jgi:hypothetical protein